MTPAVRQGRTPTGRPDMEWVERMKQSEIERRRRFDALFEAHGLDIVAYCSWRAGSPSDVQDAVADVFLTAWRRLDDVPEGDPARVWLYATARKVIANQRRSTRRRVALQERLTLEAAPVRQEPPSSGSGCARARGALPARAARSRGPAVGGVGRPHTGSVDPLLTIERLRQLVATHGNGFRLSEPFWRASHLPPIATGCDRWAP